MKKLVCILLCAAALLSLTACIKSRKPLLSQMTQEECTQKLRELGAYIPDDWTYDLRGWAAKFERDINAEYPSDVYFDTSHWVFESVRDAVKKYYGPAGPLLTVAPDVTPAP